MTPHARQPRNNHDGNAADAAAGMAIPIGGDPRPALLADRPSTLGELWAEWTHGRQGNKPARLFTPQERGNKRNMHKFCQRKPAWLKISELMGAGFTHLQAIDEIYGVYRNMMITNLLKALKADEKRGGHPDLKTRMDLKRNNMV